MRLIREIVVHCSATRPEWMAGRSLALKVAVIRKWHTDPKPNGRGWSDIGYHYLIDRDGNEAAGRPIYRIGAHVQGHNTGTIGICLIGGHGSAETDAFSDHFTSEQDKTLRALIADLMLNHSGISKVSGHNQYAAKACPGFNVPMWLARTKQPATALQPAPRKDDVPDFIPTVSAPPAAYVAAFAGLVAAIYQWGADVLDWITFWN